MPYSTDSGSDAGSYEVGFSGPFSGRDDSSAFWPDAAGLGEASRQSRQADAHQSGPYDQDAPYQDSSYQNGAYQEGAYQEPAYPSAPYRDGSYQDSPNQAGAYVEGLYSDSAPRNGAQGSSQADDMTYSQPAGFTEAPLYGEVQPPTAATAAPATPAVGPGPRPSRGASQPVGAGVDAAPDPPADELVAEGLASLRAGRAAAADGVALGDADRLLRQVRLVSGTQRARSSAPSRLVFASSQQ